MNVACQCGAVAFTTPLPKPLAVYICHCDECRRQSTSAFGCSAIFPKFQLPLKTLMSCYSRPTASGHILNCYFCKTCGTRLIHSTPGKDVVSIKGGCIEGLDWKSARHIWCKRAMVPIPEGVERDEEEPQDDIINDDPTKNMFLLRGSGGTSSDEERKKERKRVRSWKGKEKDSDMNGGLVSRNNSTINSWSPSPKNGDSRRRVRNLEQENEKIREWGRNVGWNRDVGLNREVEAELDRRQTDKDLGRSLSRDYSIRMKPNDINTGLEFRYSTEQDVVGTNGGETLSY